MPFTAQQSRDGDTTAAPLASGLGDLRAVGKLRLTELGHVKLAALLAVTFPSGGHHDYRGDLGSTVTPELLAARDFGRYRVGANLGYLARYRSASSQLIVDDELLARVGVGVRIPTTGGRLVAVDAALSANLAAADPNNAYRAAVEALAAASYRLGDVVASAGVGHALSAGANAPEWRVFAGLRYQAHARPRRRARRSSGRRCRSRPAT